MAVHETSFTINGAEIYINGGQKSVVIPGPPTESGLPEFRLAIPETEGRNSNPRKYRMTAT